MPVVNDAARRQLEQAEPLAALDDDVHACRRRAPRARLRRERVSRPRAPRRRRSRGRARTPSSGLDALVDQLPVARLEDVQRDPLGRNEHDRQREETELGHACSLGTLEARVSEALPQCSHSKRLRRCINRADRRPRTTFPATRSLDGLRRRCSASPGDARETRFPQFGAGLKSIIGGELKGMTKALVDSRNDVIQRMTHEPPSAKGANAIVAMRFDTSADGRHLDRDLRLRHRSARRQGVGADVAGARRARGTGTQVRPAMVTSRVR